MRFTGWEFLMKPPRRGKLAAHIASRADCIIPEARRTVTSILRRCPRSHATTIDWKHPAFPIHPT